MLGPWERIRKLAETFLCMSNLLRTNVESRTLFQFGVNYRIKKRDTPQALLGHEVTPDQKHLHTLAGWSHWEYFPNINMKISHLIYIFFSEEEILFFSLSNPRRSHLLIEESYQDNQEEELREEEENRQENNLKYSIPRKGNV